MTKLRPDDVLDGVSCAAIRLHRDRVGLGCSVRRLHKGSEPSTSARGNVTALVRQGLSTQDAAVQLFVSPRTVDFHLRNVFTKLGVTSRSELAALPLDV